PHDVDEPGGQDESRSLARSMPARLTFVSSQRPSSPVKNLASGLREGRALLECALGRFGDGPGAVGRGAVAGFLGVREAAWAAAAAGGAAGQGAEPSAHVSGLWGGLTPGRTQAG